MQKCPNIGALPLYAPYIASMTLDICALLELYNVICKIL